MCPSPASAGADARPSRLAVWWLALRPRTLTVSLAPVLVGTALAWAEAAVFLPWVFACTALAALCIQIGTNLHNDVADFERGTDTPERLGPPRATAMGWLAPGTVRAAAWLAFALAFLLGIALVARGGWPIVAIGLASLVAGWAYTGGPRPIAYSPFGELFVLVFFGLVAVGGSAWLQALSPSPAAWLAGALLGGFAAGVITVNNHRDRVGDARAGRRTLAILLGARGSLALYAAEVLLPFCLLPVLAIQLGRGAWMALPACLLPVALSGIRQLAGASGTSLNAVLAATARLQAGFAVLLTLALVA